MGSISRRTLFKVAGALAASAWAGTQQVRSQPAPPKFALALCVDCLRADQVGAYGCPLPITPCIDEFAKRAVVFENVYANSNWTKPSVASFFTGLWPAEHGAMGVNRPNLPVPPKDATLPEGIPTLAGVYRQRGYRTGGFVWQPNLMKEYGFGQGFDTYEVGSFDAGEIASRFRDWYRTLKPGEHVFAYLHFLDCHAPYPDRMPYTGQFGPTEMAFQSCPDWRTPGVWAAFREELNTGKRKIPREEAQALFNRYRGDVRYVDSVIGALLSELESKGALEDALVCVFGDHGENFYEHGVLGHDPPFFFEEQVRIPLIVSFPSKWRVRPGRRPQETQTIDLTATLAAAAGLRGFGHGRSLIDPVDVSRPVHIITQSADGITVVREGLKAYISMIGAVPAVAKAFDVRHDPQESRELSLSVPEAVEKIESYMRGWRDATAKTYAAFDNRRGGRAPSAEEVEALRALGYLH